MGGELERSLDQVPHRKEPDSAVEKGLDRHLIGGV